MRMLTIALLLAGTVGCATPADDPPAASPPDAPVAVNVNTEAPKPEPDNSFSVEVGKDGGSVQTSGENSDVSIDVNTETKKKKAN